MKKITRQRRIEEPDWSHDDKYIYFVIAVTSDRVLA